MPRAVFSGGRLEGQIAQELAGNKGDLSLPGIAVTVERVDPDAQGIAVTFLPRFCGPEEQGLSHSRPKNVAKGTIHAVDAENNTLWLRPQRLTKAAIDSGFLAVVGFADDGVPAYSVTAREPKWRDKRPSGSSIARHEENFYTRALLPNLTADDWKRLG